MKNIYKLLAIGFIFFLSKNADAQTTYTWTGANSDVWNNGANWDLGVPPQAGDHVIIPNTVISPQIISNVDVGNFTITGETLDIQGGLFISGDATFTNGIITGVGDLNFSNAGTVTFTGGSRIDPTLTGTAQRFFFNGTTFNSLSLTKTGNNDDVSTGGNVFRESVNLAINAGGLRFAQTDDDIFILPFSISLDNNASLYLASGADIEFNGAVNIIGTAGNTVQIGSSTGSVTMIGFNSITGVINNVRLQNVLLDATPEAPLPMLEFHAGSMSEIISSTFEGPVDVIAEDINLSNSTFGSSAIFQRTGSTSTECSGGNIFNGSTTFNLNDITGQASWSLARDAADSYNGSVFFMIREGTQLTVFSNNTPTFGGEEINLICTTDATISLGGGEPGTRAVIPSGTTLYAYDFNWTNGSTLILDRIEQSTDFDLALPNNVSLILGSSTNANGPLFLGEADISAGNLVIQNTTFNSTTLLTRTGNGAGTSFGGNTFNAAVTYATTGNGDWLLNSGAGYNADEYNGNVVFLQSNVLNGRISVCSNLAAISNFTEDLTFNTAEPAVFGPGITRINGTTDQHIAVTGAATPQFDNLVITKSSGNLVLDNAIEITGNIVFNQGLIVSTISAPVIFADLSTHTNASSASHIDGPVVKVGTSNFLFPTGDADSYSPIGISGMQNGNATTQFRAQYVQQPPSNSSNLPTDINRVSDFEYWDLTCTAGAPGEVFVELQWENDASSGVTGENDLVVAHYDESESIWENLGRSIVNNDGPGGFIRSNVRATAFSPITLGFTVPLPVTFMDFKAAYEASFVKLTWKTASEENNDYFTVLRSPNGKDFTPIGYKPGAGTTKEVQQYSFIDPLPLSGESYYRIQQTDFDGKVGYSNVVHVESVPSIELAKVYPNPVGRGKYITIDTYATEQNIKVELISPTGIILEQHVVSNSGTLQLPTEGRSGLLLVKLTTVKGEEIHRIVVY